MALNIADLFEHAADAVPDRLAIACGPAEVAAKLRRVNDELGTKARTMASTLRAAGLSIRDGAAVMELSKSRFEQLCQG